MTKDDKINFVRSICHDLQKYVLERVDRMPEEWDGIELRQYIADTASDQFCALSFRSNEPRDRKRRRDYKNEVIVRNL